MLKKLREGIADLYQAAKAKVSKIKMPSMPKRDKNVEVEWQDGQPVFKKKDDKKP